MNAFKSSLILRTNSNKEPKLAHTASIYTFKHLFATHPSMSYLYVFSSAIEIYTTSPFNLVKSIDYKKEINDMLLTKDTLYVINDNSITSYSSNDFNVVSSNFKNCKLVRIASYSQNESERNRHVGVQSKSELTIYDGSFNRLDVFRCQCAYSIRDILMLGDFNTAKIYVKGERILEIAMPDYISCITTDPLFSRVYCATNDNSIYGISMSDQSLRKMEYHTQPVKFMKLSICGEYLYTADNTMLCVWNTKSDVVVGFVEIDEGIDDLDVFIEGNRNYNEIPVLI